MADDGTDLSGPLYRDESFFDQSDELAAYVELIRRLPMAVYFKDRNARFVGVNAFFAEAMHREPDEMLGLSDFDLHPPAEAELYRIADERVMAEGVPIIGLTEVQTRLDGSVSMHQTSKFPVRNRFGDVIGLMGFSHDITEPTRAVESLRQSELRYALATHASRDGIWELEIESATLSMSPRCCQLMNLPVTAEPIPWQSVAELFDAENVRTLQRGVAALRRQPKEAYSCEVHLRVDGANRWLEVVYTAFTVEGELRRLVGSVADVTEDRERRAQLEFFALHDGLTGLMNRRALEQAVEDNLARGQRLSLLCFDLDSFKVVNDSLGHQAGDTMIEVVAGRLRDAAISRRHHLVARLGGDEFAIAITGKNETEATTLAAEILEAVRVPVEISGLELYPTVSIGVVHARDQRNPIELLRDADIALYRAKALGKDRAEVFDPEMRRKAQRALDDQTRIRRAVENGDFALVYQPVISARTRELAGFEALLRLEEPDGTTLPPAMFLDYLERSNLIIDVGRWVLDRAMADLAGWRADHPELPSLDVAVNVSRKQFADAHLFAHAVSAVERNGLTPNELVLEITETAIVSEPVDLKGILRDFRVAGGKVAIDDFGTGQSSLFALNELPVDIVKLDKSFTSRISGGTDDPMLRATIDLVQALDLLLVAEGVETLEQAVWLDRHGADYLQGYVFARPMSSGAVERYLCRPTDAVSVDASSEPAETN